MKAPKTERQLYFFLEVLRQEIVLSTIQETVQKLEMETGIFLEELDMKYSYKNLHYFQISAFLEELGDYLPSWKREIEKKIEVWL